MVQLKPLTRLRIAFVVLGALLLAPLALLGSTANERLETQRRLRHEVVGERIFDELERELTDLLDRESERPSRAYDASTRPDTWAPFIVGYFTLGPSGAEVLASSELQQERRQRIEWALGRWQTRVPSAALVRERQLELKPETSQERADAVQDSEMLVAPRAPAAPAPASPQTSSRNKGQAPRTSPEILRQLNRAGEVRQQRAPAASRHETDPLAY